MSVIPRRRKSLSYIGPAVCYHFFSLFCLHHGCRKGLEDKTYPAMDLPVCGEPSGVMYRTVLISYDRFIVSVVYFCIITVQIDFAAVATNFGLTTILAIEIKKM